MQTRVGQRLENAFSACRISAVGWWTGQTFRARTIAPSVSMGGVGPLLFVIVVSLILSAYDRFKSWIAASQ